VNVWRASSLEKQEQISFSVAAKATATKAQNHNKLGN